MSKSADMSALVAECLRLIGERVFDLDVTEDSETDWLAHSWMAPRVWCWPPEDNIEPWVQKAWEQATNCHVIAMLVPAATAQPWWQKHVEPHRDQRGCTLSTHFLPDDKSDKALLVWRRP